MPSKSLVIADDLDVDADSGPADFVDPWLYGPLVLFGEGAVQMLQLQQAMWQFWLQGAQAWWGPWSPFLERGGEQLA